MGGVESCSRKSSPLVNLEGKVQSGEVCPDRGEIKMDEIKIDKI